MKLLLAVLPAVACAFQNPGEFYHVAERSTTLFSTARRDVLAASLTGAAASIMATSQPAAAEDGKVVEFTVKNLSDGSSGVVRIKLHPDWAPKGVARFEELTSDNFWSGCRIFRVLPGFVAQFGINGDPKVQAKWRSSSISDDPVKVSNDRGTVVFATSGRNTRTTQLFINTNKSGNGFLDKEGFSPIGEVIQGMDVVDKFYAGYGEGAPSGKGPNQVLIQAKGNEYLESSYPDLSYIAEAKVQ
mmetsp:Transcript_13810/g.21046  ORF Transcript_13810/g.21046 Transcript_13810/m.21046 type:complete len:244 (-) Transcript_13810:1149-1880(-)